MADDDTTPDAGSSDPRGGGVHIPTWLAAALVVVLGIAVGGAGYAIGKDDGSSADEVEQIANVQRGEELPQLREEGPGRGPGGPGVFEHRGGPRCERGEGERREGEENEQGEEDGESSDQQQQLPDPLNPLGPNDQGF